jgi:hypothetical protein
MRDKYAKRDIKFKHNSMNIITYRARHNELVVLLELAPQGGGGRPELTLGSRTRGASGARPSDKAVNGC